MATTSTEPRVITLTNAPPVRVRDEQWPLIASSFLYDGRSAHQSERSRWLRVRRHEDGRVIVYGGLDTRINGERGLRGGEILADGENVAAAIRRVAASVDAAEIAIDCIADLPPVEL